MAQHDMNIGNQNMPPARTDVNNALAALVSNSKGPSAPATVFAGMFWIEDDNPSSTTWSWWFSDGTDWIKIGEFNTTTNTFTVQGISKANLQTILGATATGISLIEAASAAAARTAIGATSLGSTLLTAADAAAGRSAIAAPASPVSTPGVAGQWTSIATADGVGAVLPSGGIWAYFIQKLNASSGVYANETYASTAAGGTTVGNAAIGYSWVGFCYRVS